MDEVCIIPARYNSFRFPGKLLKRAGGKTVLQHTIESALGYFAKEQLFVATDDERIAEHVESLGVAFIETSPSCPTGTDRIAEALRKCTALSQAKIVLNLQGDHPCTSAETLRAVILALKSDPQAAMSTAASPIRSLEEFHAPHIVKVVVDGSGNALYFSRAPIPHGAWQKALQHVGLYCFRRETLLQSLGLHQTPLQLAEDLEQLKLLETGHRIKVALVDECSIGIDVPADLERLEARFLNE